MRRGTGGLNMAWLKETNKELNVRPETALWAVCPKCKAHIDREVWAAAHQVCPHCGAHGRLGCRERVKLLVDESTGTTATFVVYAIQQIIAPPGEAKE